MKLNNIRVLDFSQFMAGPLVSAILADHGADVIKIESQAGDPTRYAGGSTGANASDFFASLNRGKRSIVIDLKSPDAKVIVRQLVENADVLIESYGPGVTARLGIDYTTISGWNPNIVYGSITAFGQSGPLHDLPSHDQLVQAMAGAFTHDQNGIPLSPTVPIAGAVAAYAAATGILIALLAARNGQGGDHLDLSMFDATLTTRPTAIGTALQALSAPATYSHRTGIALLETYQTQDGDWISLGAHEPRFAQALLGGLGREDLIPHAIGEPGAAQEPVRQFLAETFQTRSLQEWLTWSKHVGLSLGPVLNFAQSLAHPHTSARQMLLTDPQGRHHLGTPLKFTREPGTPNLSVASLGEHSREVLSQLGLDASEVDRLIQSRVIAQYTAP